MRRRDLPDRIQDLALCDNLDIVQNMFLGREKKNGIVLDEATMEQLAADTLKRLSVRTVKSVRQVVSSLSGGQRQTVAIAKSVLWNSRLVVLDEPTAALGVSQTAPRCSSWCGSWLTTAWPSS
jgi:D-xylose transport system ATP-binding protein